MGGGTDITANPGGTGQDLNLQYSVAWGTRSDVVMVHIFPGPGMATGPGCEDRPKEHLLRTCSFAYGPFGTGTLSPSFSFSFSSYWVFQ